MFIKSISFALAFICITPTLALSFSFDDLRVNESESLGKPGFWDKITSGQIWTDWTYGAEKVSITIWKDSLKISSLTASTQQVIVKVTRGEIKTLESDFTKAKVEYLYNDSDYAYVVVEMNMENIAQKFWDEKFSHRETLADKSYVHKITLNQEMTLVTPLDYADETDVARTTYELCEDYGILDLNYSGDNISIAVLDTGIVENHKGLNGTTIYNESFVSGENWKDRNGHGTHCIGIIAGQNTTVAGEKMRGVAPNTTIYSLKVLDSKGRGTEGDIVKGIMRAVELKVDIISMSLGGYIDYFSGLHDSIHYAIGKGIIIVAAAGNSADIVSAQPASWEGVISVEALQENKHIAPYTCLGGDISAEGTNITSLNYRSYNKTSTKSGTSMACPFIAGCIALLLEAEPSLRGKPNKVLSYIRATGNYAPKAPQQVKLYGLIPAVADNYAYDTREINPGDLVGLKEVTDVSKIIITDVRTQFLRNEGV